MQLALPDRVAAKWEVQQAKGWTVTGRWLREHASPDARIASLMVGAIPYFSDLYTIDLLGLTDATIAHSGRVYPEAAPGHQRYFSEYVLSKRPDLIVLPTSGLYREAPLYRWPDVPRSGFNHAFALHDLLDRRETQTLYTYEASQLPDGTYVEYLERKATPRN